MNTVRRDDELAEQLVKRLLQTAKTLTQQGKYQEAVSTFMETFDEFPGPLTAFTRMPPEVRQALSEAWGHIYYYEPPETIPEPEGISDKEAFEALLADLTEDEQEDLRSGTIEDIARRLQISPAWVYLWWKQGVPHHREGEEGYIRFHLGLVKHWLQKNQIKMPPKVSGADSYFLVKGMVYGLREGLLSPEDIEMMAQVFIGREQTTLYRNGSFFSLADLSLGAPREGQQALQESRRLLTQSHRQAVQLREDWTPNCGFIGPHPYDRVHGQKIAADLRQLKNRLEDAVIQLETAAGALENAS